MPFDILSPTQLWPPFGGGSAPPLDLLNAIKRAFLASPAAAQIPGGIFLEKAGRRAPFPYVVAVEQGGRLSLATDRSLYHKTRFGFRVYAQDLDAAGVVGDALEDSFTGLRLRFAGGFTGPFVPVDRKHKLDYGTSRAGDEVWYLLVEFEFQVRRGGV